VVGAPHRGPAHADDEEQHRDGHAHGHTHYRVEHEDGRRDQESHEEIQRHSPPVDELPRERTDEQPEAPLVEELDAYDEQHARDDHPREHRDRGAQEEHGQQHDGGRDH